MSTRTLTVGGREVEVTHPDRVLFPADGITKQDLAEYYAAVGPPMIPHLRGRPLMMQRFPNGVDRPGFMQKDGSRLPGWVHRIEVRKEGGTVVHAIADEPATLVLLANQSCVTLHAWLSRVGHLDSPDQLMFDLDPSTEGFGQVRDAALAVRELLGELHLAAYVKATGSRGLHVVTPLDGGAGLEEVRAFARDAAGVLVARMPSALTLDWSRERRGGRLYLDTLRVGYAQTAVAPYSVRPLAGAPVAVPLRWEELEEPGFDVRAHTLRTVPSRVAREGDPWAGMERHARSLREPRRRLERLAGR